HPAQMAAVPAAARKTAPRIKAANPRVEAITAQLLNDWVVFDVPPYLFGNGRGLIGLLVGRLIGVSRTVLCASRRTEQDKKDDGGRTGGEGSLQHPLRCGPYSSRTPWLFSRTHAATRLSRTPFTINTVGADVNVEK